jgi:hypothetical protein
MIEWMRFALIVCIAVIDHVVYEVVLSFNTTRDFVWYRLRWIASEKLRTLWPGRGGR